MTWLWENLLGLKRGFLNMEGERSLGFNPKWPGAPLIDAGVWNWFLAVLVLAGLAYLFHRVRRRTLSEAQWWTVSGIALGLITLLFMLISGTVAFNVFLAALAIVVLLYVYPREGRSRLVRISLGIVRAMLLAFVIALLNRPVINLSQDRIEPSVVAVLVDDSISMSVKDVRPDAGENSPSRLEAVIEMLSSGDKSLIRKLAEQHQVRFYEFDAAARQKGTPVGDGRGEPPKEPVAVPKELEAVIRGLKADGQTTAVVPSLLNVLEELQGQRLAGVVVITDGVETAPGRTDEALKKLREFHANIYPVAVGSEKAPTNIEVQSVNVQDAAFVDDIVLLKAQVRGSGYEANHSVKVSLKTSTGAPLIGADGRPVEKTVNLPDDNPVEVELQFKPDKVGALQLQTVAEKQPGEIDPRDNVRPAEIAVLDAKINVLYVDGYPRWEYRYLKNEMLRDKTVNISCLLTSADPSFAQEGDKPDPETGADRGSKFPGPITRFPETLDEIMKYDVVLFGDVDPRQFSDRQLQLLSDFVSKKGGGFGMAAGPRWSPQAYRNSPVEAILPVAIARVQSDTDTTGVITEGFRPILTRAGAASSIFRFFPDKAANDKFIAEQIEPLFWYCRNISAKPAAEVFAEHPVETNAEGRKAPLLVLGRFGAGRTLFSAIDDSWRWRYYTGESIFDTYWIQQLRYLARSRKIGQRQFNFSTDRETYTLGEPVRLELRILDPVLSQQLSRELSVEIRDESGQTVRREQLARQETPPDTFAVSFPADKVGRYSVRLPAMGSNESPVDIPLEIIVPRLELAKPAVNMPLLRQLAVKDEKTGQPIVLDVASAATKLPGLIRSAVRIVPIPNPQPLWDAPLAFAIFIGLITTEWVLRKMYGML